MKKHFPKYLCSAQPESYIIMIHYCEHRQSSCQATMVPYMSSIRWALPVAAVAVAAIITAITRIVTKSKSRLRSLDPRMTSAPGNTVVESKDTLYYSHPPTSAPKRTPTPKLYALLIGINKYRDPNVPDLRGAVPDALSVEGFLKLDIGVPQSRIQSLHDEQATRANIMNAIDSIASHPEINKDDPILIYYAGHGTQAPTPISWPVQTKNVNIQMIVPHDFVYHMNDGSETQGCLDITLSVLLSKIAEVKGNNITVIFDCCHSASGTRDIDVPPNSTFISRGIELSEDYKINPTVDYEILFDEGRATTVSSKYESHGLKSHVLLAACMTNQTAKELEGRGLFTSELLNLLRMVGTENITYKDLIARLPDFIGQNPQCEGVHQDRNVFDAKAPSLRHILYRVKNESGDIVLEAGEAHGITDEAQFTIYKDLDMRSEVLGILTAYDCGAFTSKLKSTGGKSSFLLDKPAYASQVQVGDREDIKVYIGQDERLVPLRDRIFESMDEHRNSGRSTILIVSDKNLADLSIIVKDDVAFFELMNAFCRERGLQLMPFPVVLDASVIFSILTVAANFYWHLVRSSDSKITTKFASNIKFECHKLIESETQLDEDLLPLVEPVGEDLVVDDRVINVNVDDHAAYGFKIVNTSSINLYVSLFYFDMSDLSISPYYQPGFAKDGKVEMSLPADGTLEIGYGSGGANPQSYFLRDNQDVDIGFLKLFYSTKYVDFSNIPQRTPFNVRNLSSVKSRKNIKEPFWGAKTVYIVQRKE